MSGESTGERTVGVAVLGLGFMGATHLGAYRRAAEAGRSVRVRAVSDRSPERLEGRVGAVGNLATEDSGASLFDPGELLATPDIDRVLGADDVDLVSICTPTDTHVDLAVRALEAGKHVLVEKPVALVASDVERLRAAEAAAAGPRCIPAMCMRFWPGWTWLQDVIATKRFGRTRSVCFERLSPVPAWSEGFYLDEARSGGAWIDLHVHDADFVRFCFGEPRQVEVVGDRSLALARYVFEDGPARVTAEGGWIAAPSFEFRMAYRAVFDEAVAEFDSRLDPPLRVAGASGSVAVELPEGTGYDAEIEHAVDVASGCCEPAVTVDDAVRTTRLLECELDSLVTGRPVDFLADAS